MVGKDGSRPFQVAINMGLLASGAIVLCSSPISSMIFFRNTIAASVE
jgi:hypothetical protein